MAARCEGQVLVPRSLNLGLLCVSWGVTSKGPELSRAPLPAPSQPPEHPACFCIAGRLRSEAPAPKGALNPCEQEESKSPSAEAQWPARSRWLAISVSFGFITAGLGGSYSCSSSVANHLHLSCAVMPR